MEELATTDSGLLVPQRIVNAERIRPEIKSGYVMQGGHSLVMDQRPTRERVGPNTYTTLFYYRTRRGLRVAVSDDETPDWGALRHVSISFKNRLPTWDEVREIKSIFFGPDIDAMMVMPKEGRPVDRTQLGSNSHVGECYHIWETPQDWGLM